MRKICRLVLLLTLALSVTGCGASIEVEGGVTIAKDGSIIGAVSSVLDKDYYDKDELKSMIDDEVAAVNSKLGDKSVEVKTYEVAQDGLVTLKLKYKDSQAYKEFNGTEFYSGDSMTANDTYGLNGNFVAVSNGVIATEDAVVPESSKVVVVSENMNVSVPSDIVAVTDNVEVTGKQTAAVKLKGADGTTGELAYIVYK